MAIRPSWDEYFMEIVGTVAKRGTCDRGRTGAIIVKNKRILTTGYVGSAGGMPHCDEKGHLIHKVYDEKGNASKHCIRTLHAEQNSIIQAAKFGISIEGSTMYCKITPCFVCAKMIVNSGIKRVVAEKRYHTDRLSVKLFENAGVKFESLSNEIERYKDQ